SQVARRSTGVSNSGCSSTKSRSRPASTSRETSSPPRRCASSSMPRSVKYIPHPNSSPPREGGLHQSSLLQLVDFSRAGRRGRRWWTGDTAQPHTLQVLQQVEGDVGPGALVGGFLLDPRDVLGVGVGG